MLILPTFALLAPAMVQTTFGVNSEQILPTLSGGRLDHAVVAFNDDGDICVAWHAHTDATSSLRQVEAVVLPRQTGKKWRDPSLVTPLLLGDPALALLSANESCTKPDVVGLGQDFAITWPRLDSALNVAQLEIVRLRKDPATGQFSTDAPSPGAGWVVDAQVQPGMGGVMPDLARRSSTGRNLSVVYAEETRATTTSAGVELEYEVKWIDFDWTTSPPLLVSSGVLATTSDDSLYCGCPEGRVLPDAVEDDFGMLVCAFEEYRLAHHGAVTENTGSIRVVRSDTTPSSGVITLEDERHIHLFEPSDRLRRPNISTSNSDFRNAITLTWQETPEPYADQAARGTEVEFHGGTQTGTLTWTDMGIPNHGGINESLPIPVHAQNLRGVVYCANLSGQGARFLAQYSSTPSTAARILATLADDAWRPAVCLVQVPNKLPGTRFSRLVVFSFEANGPNGNRSRIYLKVVRL